MTKRVTLEKRSKIKELAAKGVSRNDIARMTGSAPTTVRAALSDEDTQRRTFERLKNLMLVDHAPRALEYIARWMDDGEVSMKIRLDCAKFILEKAGFVNNKAEANSLNTNKKALEDLSREQLHAQLLLVEAELGNRAEVVEDIAPAPRKAGRPPKPVLSNLLE